MSNRYGMEDQHAEVEVGRSWLQVDLWHEHDDWSRQVLEGRPRWIWTAQNRIGWRFLGEAFVQ